MNLKSGKSVLNVGLPTINNNSVGNGGGNSGAVISPAPGLGLSAYQNPDIPVGPLPKQQGAS